MSYFDHAQCPNCNAAFDPEKIAGGPGSPMKCPYCGHELGVASLFGLKDAFSEAGEAQLTLDDLSPDDGDVSAWAGAGGHAPDPLGGELPLGARAPRPADQKPAKKKPATNGKTAEPWDKDRGHMVHVPGEDDDEPAPSAMDALKRLK